MIKLPRNVTLITRENKVTLIVGDKKTGSVTLSRKQATALGIYLIKEGA